MAQATPAGARRSKRGLLRWLAYPCALALSACSEPPAQTLHFTQGASEVVVNFHGEVSDDSLFAASASLLQQVRPLDQAGKPVGGVMKARPGWLRFSYQVAGVRREVLVAKQPLMNYVAWDDIARAGAAGPSLPHELPGASAQAPGAVHIFTRDGGQYRVRLPTCGQSTLGDLSEWNLLVGAVHRGDMDFAGSGYGWVRQPYDDEALKVGLHGSLTWCQEARRADRVARGYFFVSRFHSAPPHIRTDRLAWRPVLERVEATATATATSTSTSTVAARPGAEAAGPQAARSPSGRVGYLGVVGNAELFGPQGHIDELVRLADGRRLESGQPDWLRFHYEGRALLVAAKPVRLALSWDAIARAGAALGDGSYLRQGWRLHAQSAEVRGQDGTRYRVRLLDCGTATLDTRSEWNALLGGVHRGDGDFLPSATGVHGWLNPAFDDVALHMGFDHGSATWCRNRMTVDGDDYAVNRGFLTVSRFHATPTGFAGAGFGWRPVLEEIK